MIRNKEQQQNAVGSGVSKGYPSVAVQFNSVGIAFSLFAFCFFFSSKAICHNTTTKMLADQELINSKQCIQMKASNIIKSSFP